MNEAVAAAGVFFYQRRIKMVGFQVGTGRVCWRALAGDKDRTDSAGRVSAEERRVKEGTGEAAKPGCDR